MPQCHWKFWQNTKHLLQEMVICQIVFFAVPNTSTINQTNVEMKSNYILLVSLTKEFAVVNKPTSPITKETNNSIQLITLTVWTRKCAFGITAPSSNDRRVRHLNMYDYNVFKSVKKFTYEQSALHKQQQTDYSVPWRELISKQLNH